MATETDTPIAAVSRPKTITVEIAIGPAEARLIEEIISVKNRVSQLTGDSVWTFEQYAEIAARDGFSDRLAYRHESICGAKQ